jgi:hemerythrin-like domain-containing protein
MLLACHTRLRHFSELALAVANRTDLEPAQIVDASHRLLRYFRVALPLHEADEEETLTPVLVEVASPEQIEALEQMHDQHGLLHDILAELFPRWDKMEADPRSIDGRDTLPQARRLAAVFDVHLALEESTIFPVIHELEQVEQQKLLAEIRARRTPDVMSEMKTIVT